MFSKQELNNILALINRSQISGQEAISVALLIQKITGLLRETTEVPASTEKDPV